MTSPTDIPTTQPAAPGQEAEGEAAPLSLRRTLRTPGAESWEILGGEQDAEPERVGVVTLHFGDDAVEGILALPEVEPDAVRGILGWVTDLLQLDSAAGPGGMIHWTVVTGEIEDFWRRSPGRRATGAELDLVTARARIEQVLTAMFPQVGTLPDGGYAVDAGSVRVFVGVRQVEGIVLVRVFAITNLDVQVDGDLPRFLLQQNFQMALGRFSLDPEQRSVWFDHVLGTEDLDDGTLARTIAAVAQTADRYDDQIKERFGGRTFREEGSPVEGVKTEPGMAGGYL